MKWWARTYWSLATRKTGSKAAKFDREFVILAEEPLDEADGVGSELVATGPQVLFGFHCIGGFLFGCFSQLTGVLDERPRSRELGDAAGGIEPLGDEFARIGAEGVGYFTDVAVFERIVEI